jgi:choline dehydrogenase-like flavoprotein
MKNPMPHYNTVIIGSGFGGSMTALPLADAYKTRAAGESILILERGTWWTTPISTVQDKEIHTAEFLEEQKQPVQFWSSQNHFRGFIDIFTRCLRRTRNENIFTRLFKRFRNEDGLFEITRFGTRGFLGLFGGKSDGITVIRASGVGGGSLVYSNITIQPPDLVFDDVRWPSAWDDATRKSFFARARNAIGHGIIAAIRAENESDPIKKKQLLAGGGNSGLSNIVMRTARLEPHWDAEGMKRQLKQVHIHDGTAADKQNRLWLDRARVFQGSLKTLTPDFGAVDLSINDLSPENAVSGDHDPPLNYPNESQGDLQAGVFGKDSKNYCDRQGRCNVGCLPGARHTLNKQLMVAALGKPDGTDPLFPNLTIKPLCEVDVICLQPDGAYEIRYVRRQKEDPTQEFREKVTADIVIVAAGCLGTNEIMLRSKRAGTLPNLSDKVGSGFSTNGDYLAFLERTKERASIVRGPVTTSFGHFNTTEDGTGPEKETPPDVSKFHTLEDQGIPPALASVVGEGVPLIQSLSRGNTGEVFVLQAVLRYMRKRLVQYVREFFSNSRKQGAIFRSEEEIVSNMMCVVAMGRDRADAQFELGGGRNETPLRVTKGGGIKFWEDPIYSAIEHSLRRLAAVLRPMDSNYEFVNPFLTNVADTANAKSIALSHPLGGCRMAANAEDGVVDEYGRVFDTSKKGPDPFYRGLYIADASIIPTALGVNPSLTISALALRIVKKLITDLA